MAGIETTQEVRIVRSIIVAAVSIPLLIACAPMLPAPAAAPAVAAQAKPAPQLAGLAHWVGGKWVGEFEAGGRKFTVIRSYEWSFDGRLLIGKSFGVREGKPFQTRETVYFWNPETRRVEFTDYLDAEGGFGQGYLETRDGQIYMDVKIVGNPGHPSWRAWMKEDPDSQVIKVEAWRDGKWSDFGTYPYKRQR